MIGSVKNYLAANSVTVHLVSLIRAGTRALYILLTPGPLIYMYNQDIIHVLYKIRAATRENQSSGFPTRSDTNRAVQAQEMATSLKFRI